MIVVLITFGIVVLIIIVFILVNSRRQSKESRLKEMAAKLREEPKFKEADLVVDIVYSARASFVGTVALGVPEYYTRLRATHKGRIPCVILVKRPGSWDRSAHRMGALSIRFMNVETFQIAKRQGLHELDWPRNVSIDNKKISTAVGKDALPQCMKLAKFVFNTEVESAIVDVPFIILRVEPKVATLMIEGYVVHEGVLRWAADLLLLLSDRVQKAENII